MADFRVVAVEDGQVDLYFDPVEAGMHGELNLISVSPPGTELLAGQECALIETTKVNIELSSPFSGTVISSTPPDSKSMLTFIKPLLRLKISV